MFARSLIMPHAKTPKSFLVTAALSAVLLETKRLQAARSLVARVAGAAKQIKATSQKLHEANKLSAVKEKIQEI